MTTMMTKYEVKFQQSTYSRNSYATCRIPAISCRSYGNIYFGWYMIHYIVLVEGEIIFRYERNKEKPFLEEEIRVKYFCLRRGEPNFFILLYLRYQLLSEATREKTALVSFSHNFSPSFSLCLCVGKGRWRLQWGFKIRATEGSWRFSRKWQCILWDIQKIVKNQILIIFQRLNLRIIFQTLFYRWKKKPH